MVRAMIVAALAFAPVQSLAGPGDNWCVTDAARETGLHVRSGPSADSETVMVIGSGRVLVEFSEKDGWLNVGVSRAKGRDGFVPKAAVSRKDLDGQPCGS